VALARALADPREHGHAAVLLREVVDELLDDHGLAHARAAEEADLAPAKVRLQQVDDLDAGLEHLHLGRLVRESGGGAVDRIALVRLHRPALVHGLPDDVQHAAQGRAAHGYGDGSARVRGLHAPHHAVRGQHADAAHAVLPEVLLHLGDHVELHAARRLALDAQSVVDRGHLLVELDVHHGADDLHHPADVLLVLGHAPPASGGQAWLPAPETTWMISFVIAACRTLFM